MTRLHRVVAATVLAAAALVPAAAQASENQLSIMQDDDLLVYRDDQTRDAALRQMKGLGVDAVRVTVLWSVVAENANDTPAQHKRFKKLKASNPKAYPKLNWDRYDRLARACKTLGIICYFNVTGPGPSWSHPAPPKKYARDAKWWKPDKRQFYSFVQAVGKRYSGQYRDENDGRPTLPKVGMWSLWNEPNQGAWLRPQWLNGKAVSPQLYRDLWSFGYRALVSTGHSGDLLIAGETAPRSVPRKTTTSAMGARTFITEFFCAGANRAGCTTFDKTPFAAKAWGHHFYTRKDAPTVPDPNPDVLSIANYGAFTGLLDQLAGQTGKLQAGLPILNSEFGYETNPPDPFNGVSLAQQATFQEVGELLSFNQPRVIGHAQFLLRDAKPAKQHRANSRPYWGSYQSGVLTAGGTAKPSATSFTFPFLATVADHDPATGAPITSIWGQLKFRPDGAQDQVQLEWKPADGSSDFVPIGDPLTITNAKGFFTATATFPGAGSVRARWTGGGIPSLEQPVG